MSDCSACRRPGISDEPEPEPELELEFELEAEKATTNLWGFAPNKELELLDKLVGQPQRFELENLN